MKIGTIRELGMVICWHMSGTYFAARQDTIWRGRSPEGVHKRSGSARYARNVTIAGPGDSDACPHPTMNDTAPLIVVDQVCKYYPDGQVRALDNISLMIGQEEYVAIMGPSGSGKSTLLNL